MNITMVGTGYVGLVTGACLAEVGHDLVCMDVAPAKLDKLKVTVRDFEDVLPAAIARGRL